MRARLIVTFFFYFFFLRLLFFWLVLFRLYKSLAKLNKKNSYFLNVFPFFFHKLLTIIFSIKLLYFKDFQTLTILSITAINEWNNKIIINLILFIHNRAYLLMMSFFLNNQIDFTLMLLELILY